MKKTAPLIIGLTGSIGMGKSTVCKMFARLGLPIFEADKAVHALLGAGGKAVKPIVRLCPDCLRGEAIHRAKLGERLFSDAKLRKKVEAILHPLVWCAREQFLKEAKAAGASAVILDIPLLFETGADKQCNVTICVSAKAAVQRERVLKRPGMSAKKFKAIVQSQMPDAVKRSCADFIIRTDTDVETTRRQTKMIWQTILLNEDTYRA